MKDDELSFILPEHSLTIKEDFCQPSKEPTFLPKRPDINLPNDFYTLVRMSSVRTLNSTHLYNSLFILVYF